MNDTNEPPKEDLGPIEYSSEVTESTGNQHFNNEASPTLGVPKEQTLLAIIGLILALPLPIFVIILWITLNTIKGQGQGLGEGTMNAVFLYLFQFFIVPLLTTASIIIGFIVTMKSKQIAKKIGYISFGITVLGFIILGIFLNHS